MRNIGNKMTNGVGHWIDQLKGVAQSFAEDFAWLS